MQAAGPGTEAISQSDEPQKSLPDPGRRHYIHLNLEFSLFDALSGGGQIGSTQTASTVTITNGLFTVPLDFGAGAFGGDNRWLQIAVRCPV